MNYKKKVDYKKCIYLYCLPNVMNTTTCYVSTHSMLYSFIKINSGGIVYNNMELWLV